MENLIEINNNILSSENHLFLVVDKGLELVKAKDLKENNKIIGMNGESIITKIYKCAKRPDAPIIKK